jgi:hypothetical protein
LDIVFSGKSEGEEDKALISALKSHPKVVLSVLHRNFEEKPVRDFIDASSSMGFLNKPLHGGVVDKARTFYEQDKKGVAFSLEVEILLSYLGLKKEQVKIDRQGLFLKDELLVPSKKGILPLNSCGGNGPSDP